MNIHIAGQSLVIKSQIKQKCLNPRLEGHQSGNVMLDDWRQCGQWANRCNRNRPTQIKSTALKDPYIIILYIIILILKSYNLIQYNTV